MQSTQSSYDEITAGLVTKADKIRALSRQGASIGDVARYLNIRYQHVRNVLVRSGLHKPRSTGSGRASPREEHAGEELSGWVQLDKLGRLQIPADLREKAGLAGDEPVHLRTTADGIEILSRMAALKRAKSIIGKYVPPGVSLADELIAERRRESARENE